MRQGAASVCVGYQEAAASVNSGRVLLNSSWSRTSLKALPGQGFCLAKSGVDREIARGDGLTVEVVANATWIVPRSGYSEERVLFVVDGTPS